MTIQVVLLVGLIIAHVTPAIKEGRLNCVRVVRVPPLSPT